MSRGLLHGLAERALGVAPPLRSQLAARAADASPDEPQASPPAMEPGRLMPQPPASPVAASPVTAATSVEPPDLQDAPAMRTGPEEQKAGAPTLNQAHATPVASPIIHPAVLVDAARPRDLRALVPDAAQLQRPRDEQRMPDPAPLLPPQPAAWPSQIPGAGPAPSVGAVSRRFGVRRDDTPTEVHVSIGRVELTALPPASRGARPAPQRDKGRDLADYLRAGAKGQP